MIELCACGHANDHVGKRCAHPIGNDIAQTCRCMSGRRIDDAALEVALETQATLMRLLAVVETVAGLQSRVVPSGDGGMHIEVRPRPNQSKLIVPG